MNPQKIIQASADEAEAISFDALRDFRDAMIPRKGRHMPRYNHALALARHEAGMRDHTIWAVPKIIPQLFGGQRNFGATGPDRSGTTIHSYGIETSDGWLYTFATLDQLHGFFRAHRRGLKRTEADAREAGE